MPGLNSKTVTILAAAIALSGCASTRFPETAENGRPAAILSQSAAAHGMNAFAGIRDISVRYDGGWAAIAPKLQPVLADSKYRSASEERLQLRARTIAQLHRGPDGEKYVVRTPESVSVRYDGIANDEPDVRAAAALVADAYTMFLLGPFFFQQEMARNRAQIAYGGTEKIDGAVHDRLVITLRPGFGEADKDRVLVSIGRADRILRRVYFTLNGLDSTQGAAVDVTFSDHKRIGGVLWPTRFYERIRAPLKLPAHRWRMTGLDLNRGLTAADLGTISMSSRAATPAQALER